VADAYIFDPIETDWSALQTGAFDYLQDQWPTWVPNEGNLETWQIAALARMVSEAMDVASDVPPAIFKVLGTSLLGLPPIAATPATVNSTWTLGENPDGQTIGSDTLVYIESADGGLIPFEVVADVVVAPGVLTTGPGEVQLRSQDGGAATSNLGGTGYVAELGDPLDWVDTVTLTGSTVDGADEEDDFDYLDRLRRRLTLMAPRPVVASDFEVMAVDIAAQHGAVIRATALDGYNPADSTTDNEKMISIATAMSDTGDDIPSVVEDAIDAELQTTREVNFVINMISPTRTPVDVTFVGVTTPGWDPSDVEPRAIQAVQDFLQPFNFGISTNERGNWINRLYVLRQDVSAVLNAVIGFERWTSLTIGLNGGAQTNAEEFAITGAAPLTVPGVIDGTVTSA
jgi:hypothetical protein